MKQGIYNTACFFIVITAFILFVTSCKDIQEEDISGLTVVLHTPANSTTTEVLTHTFWWSKIDGATEYNLQIASPSFLTPEYLILDSNVTSNKYTFTLNPGSYEWRVKAMNGAYETDYTTYTLQIDSTPDLSGQQIVLISPNDNFATNNQTITFKWYTLYNADDYRFEIRTPDWNGSLAYPVTITQYDTLNITLNEGFYVWGVQGQNLTSNSPFSSRSIVIDTTSPGIPVLTYPSDDATINDSTLTNSEITFRWQRGSNSGSEIKDSLYVSTDSLFLSGIIVSVHLADTVYTKAMTTEDEYFWKVRSIDAAGNYGNNSVIRKFVYEK